MRKSPFEGWTKQCYRSLREPDGSNCAIGWLIDTHGWVTVGQTINRVVPLLKEKFPEIPQCEGIVYANNELKLTPEIFLSLDREAIAMEESLAHNQERDSPNQVTQEDHSVEPVQTVGVE